MRGSRWLRALGQAALLVGMLLAWVVFAPSAFGGQTAYVIVAGASMEPTLHQGDLVLARRAPGYEVGDIVTYTHPQVGPVIHRIIERQGARYALQGDANSWVDSYLPTTDEIVGRSWIVLRRAGSLLLLLRSPRGLALLSLSFAAILVLTIGRRGDRHPRPAGAERDSTDMARRTAPSDGLWILLGALGLGSALLALSAFSQPLTTLVPDEAPFRHSGAFGYHATAPASVYAGGTIETGDPIYDALVPTFDVAFDYALATDHPANVEGTIALTLEVSEPNGWRRRIAVQPPTAFEGTRASAFGRVDMTLVRRTIALLEQATGVDRSAYFVDLIAEVELRGTLAGQPLETRFQPRLPFALDDYQAYLRIGDSPTGETIDPTLPVEDGLISLYRQTPAGLQILGLQVPVATARAAAVVGLLATASGAAAVFVPYLRTRRAGEATRVLADYAEALVSLRHLPFPPGEIVEVASFEDLAKMSERSGRMILHAQDGGAHHFYFPDGDVTYHLRLSDGPAAEA